MHYIHDGLHSLLPWHEKLWQSFVPMLHRRALPHALLFTGLPGLGKRYFAERLAACILCQQSTVEGPCGACKNCQILSSGDHPDLLRLSPDNKSRFIRVEDIRYLTEWVTRSAYAGDYKVVILDPADAMNLSASNSLLKTLEEPASQTIFILISAVPMQLPATIRSRCQRVIFSSAESESSKAWLTSKIDSSLDVDLLFHLAHEAPLKALALADVNVLKARTEFLEDIIELWLKKRDPVEIAARWHQSDLSGLLQTLYILFIDLVKIRLTGKLSGLYHYDFGEHVRCIAEVLDPVSLFAIQDKIQDLYRAQQAGFNLNTQLLLEDLFIEICQCTVITQRAVKT